PGGCPELVEDRVQGGDLFVGSADRDEPGVDRVGPVTGRDDDAVTGLELTDRPVLVAAGGDDEDRRRAVAGVVVLVGYPPGPAVTEADRYTGPGAGGSGVGPHRYVGLW